MAHGFSDRALRDIEPIFQKHTNALLGSFRDRSSHSDVEVVNWYEFTGNDTISGLTFGKSFNCIGSEHVHSWNLMLYESLQALSRFAYFKFLYYPAIERSLLLVLLRSVIESVHAQFDLTRATLHKCLPTRVEVGGLVRSTTMIS